ncbi:MAG: hypothetical protein RIQ53_3289, partial [Pseudomonadota bacterium]
MAVAIPILMTAAGASTAVTLGVSLAAGITGLSASIDKAAAKVFGKDLVQIGNIAGAIALATGSVPDLSGAGSVAGAGGLEMTGAELGSSGVETLTGGQVDVSGLGLLQGTSEVTAAANGGATLSG